MLHHLEIKHRSHQVYSSSIFSQRESNSILSNIIDSKLIIILDFVGVGRICSKEHSLGDIFTEESEGFASMDQRLVTKPHTTPVSGI